MTALVPTQGMFGREQIPQMVTVKAMQYVLMDNFALGDRKLSAHCLFSWDGISIEDICLYCNF